MTMMMIIMVVVMKILLGNRRLNDHDHDDAKDGYDVVDDQL